MSFKSIAYATVFAAIFASSFPSSSSYSPSSTASDSPPTLGSPSGDRNNASSTTSTGMNVTSANDNTSIQKLMNRLIHDQNTLIQASCVLLAVVFVIFAVVVLKFVLKKQRESKTLKYGVIMEAGSVEMRPLEDVDDDDDEDETLFEKKSALDDHRKLLRWHGRGNHDDERK